VGFDTFDQYAQTRDALSRDLLAFVDLRARLSTLPLNDEEIARRVAPLEQRITALTRLGEAYAAFLLDPMPEPPEAAP